MPSTSSAVVVKSTLTALCLLDLAILPSLGYGPGSNPPAVWICWGLLQNATHN
jgi:hypothetical protein